VDAAQAIADLMEISSQVRSAAVIGADGAVEAASADEAGQTLARTARGLLEAAGGVRTSGDSSITQLEAAAREGSVFVVRDSGGRVVAATTGASPTVGLVFYDLKTCLRAVAGESNPSNGKPKRRRRTAKASAEAGEAA
jgi:predicted regulator of Ras-like GTPase activity (Roadblock/LC7/MglB family)